MTKLLENVFVRFVVTLASVFLLATLFMPPEVMKRYLDAARIGIFAVLFAITVRTAWSLFWANSKTGGERAAVTLSLLAFTILVASIWIPLRREVGYLMPPWLYDGYMGCIIVLLYCVSGAGFLMPIGNEDGATPPRNYWFIAAAFGIGGVVAGLFIGMGITIPE